MRLSMVITLILLLVFTGSCTLNTPVQDAEESAVPARAGVTTSEESAVAVAGEEEEHSPTVERTEEPMRAPRHEIKHVCGHTCVSRTSGSGTGDCEL
jgi:hypothetical protein